MSEPTIAVKNPSAKLQFLSSPTRVKNHNRIFEGYEIQDSINMALLHFQRELLVGVTDGISASAAGMKLKGAAEFVDILFKLGDANAKPHSNVPTLKLDHNA